MRSLSALDRTVLPPRSLWRARDVRFWFAKRTRQLAAARARRNSRYQDLSTTFVRQFIRWPPVHHFLRHFRWSDSVWHGFNRKFRWHIHSMTALRLACIEMSILPQNNSAAMRALIGA